MEPSNSPLPNDFRGYRLSEKFLKLWSRITFICMGVGFAALIILLIIMAIVYGDAPSEDVPMIWAYLLIGSGVLAIGIPLLIGAIIGGLAIHPLGWLPLLFVIGGLISIGLAQLDGLGFLTLYSIMAMVIGVVGIWLLGLFRSKVDMWVGLPMLYSPRLYVRKGQQQKQKNK